MCWKSVGGCVCVHVHVFYGNRQVFVCVFKEVFGFLSV